MEAWQRLWSFTGAIPITLFTYMNDRLKKKASLDEPCAGRVQKLEGVGTRKIDPTARGFAGRGDPALSKAVRRRFDGIFRNPPFGRPRVRQQNMNQRLDGLGICGRAQMRGPVRSHVGLDHHHVSLMYVVSDAANPVEGLSQPRHHLAAAPDGDVRGAGLFRHAEGGQLEGLFLL